MTAKLSFNRKVLLGAFLFTSLASAFTNIALAEESTTDKAINTVQENVGNLVDAVSGNQPSSTPAKFVSDGTKVEISKLGIKIAPPQGWEVISDHPTLSLVMQEVAPEKTEYDVPIYQRNITVAAIHEPAPIDEKRAAQLKDELTNKFGKQVTNFQIIEHKFFDYKAKGDGLVVFSSFQTGEFNMMQMHVLVSGEAHQILMSYTDLQARFSDKATYDAAWNTMASVEVNGQPPMRYRQPLTIAAIAVCLFVIVALLLMLRSRRERNRYRVDADEIYSDDDSLGEDFSFNSRATATKKRSHQGSSQELDFPATRTGVWNLGSEPQGSFASESLPASKLKDRHSRDEEGGLSFVTGF